MRVFGAVMTLAGILLAGFAFFVFDPSIETSGGRVNNIGLLQTQQNMLIVGCVVGAIGALLAAFGGLGNGGKVRPAGKVAPEDLSVRQRTFLDAIRYSKVPLAKSMLELGHVRADDKLPGDHDWLQLAVKLKARTIIPVLLEFGASPSRPDSVGKTAIKIADELGDAELSAQLRCVAEGMANVSYASAHTLGPEQSGAGPSSDDERLTRLSKLAELRDRGALTAEEFAAEKRRLLLA
jgi:hypothetical protein